jgi:hypothetical protein
LPTARFWNTSLLRLVTPELTILFSLLVMANGKSAGILGMVPVWGFVSDTLRSGSNMGQQMQCDLHAILSQDNFFC